MGLAGSEALDNERSCDELDSVSMLSKSGCRPFIDGPYASLDPHPPEADRVAQRDRNEPPSS